MLHWIKKWSRYKKYSTFLQLTIEIEEHLQELGYEILQTTNYFRETSFPFALVSEEDEHIVQQLEEKYIESIRYMICKNDKSHSMWLSNRSNTIKKEYSIIFYHRSNNKSKKDRFKKKEHFKKKFLRIIDNFKIEEKFENL